MTRNTSRKISQKTPRLVIIVCRGGMDGLSCITRPDELVLQQARPDLLEQETLPLTAGFAFHPALKTMHGLFNDKDLVFMHAAGLPRRDRSHFVSQDILESGQETPHPKTGWLGRAMTLTSTDTYGVAYGATLPLILSGADNCFNWTNPELNPEDEEILSGLGQYVYPSNRALRNALHHVENLRNNLTPKGQSARQKKRNTDDRYRIIGQLLVQDEGPNIGVISVSGWDTHNDQRGRLKKGFQSLDAGVATLNTLLADVWADTVIVIMSEFGRTVRQNGTQGTDHGTAGVVMVAGGSIRGGQQIGGWPGLRQDDLLEGRDLYPQNDSRQIYANILQNHMNVAKRDICDTVFPGLNADFEALRLFQ